MMICKVFLSVVLHLGNSPAFSVVIKLFVVEVQHMSEEVVVELFEEFDPGIEAVVITLLRVGDAVAQLELPLGGKSTSVEGLHKIGELSGVPLVKILFHEP